VKKFDESGLSVGVFRFLVLAIAIMSVGCSKEPEEQLAEEQMTEDQPTVEQSAADQPVVDQPVIDQATAEQMLQPETGPVTISVATDDGMFLSTEYKGKVIYLDFWASWCGPCRESFPWMNEMRAKYGEDGLHVIAVSLDQDKDLARQFAAEFNAEFMIGFDLDGSVANQFGVRGLPSSVIIGRDGKLVESHTGFNQIQAVEFEESLVKVLEKS